MELDHIHLPPNNHLTSSSSNSSSVKIGFSGDNGVGGPGPGHTNPGATMCLTPPTDAMNAGAGGRFGRQWQNSSRIIRVSRASGGKDRHSKVWTAKGARDRRVRLSVNTAIQFYDLQDRLGYDQPSKAVEWLIKAAAESINDLPSLDSSNFPPELRSGNNNAVVDNSAELQINGDNNNNNKNNNLQDRSGCSSNNSDGSGLSLSRTEIRVKARERARERTAKEKKEMENESRVSVAIHAHNANPSANNGNSQSSSSFTQLLTAGITNLRDSGRNSDGGDNSNGVQWLPDYSRDGPLPHVMALLPSFSGSASNSNQIHQQQFPFLIEQQHPADFNRGTLQSNSSSTSSTQTPSFLPYFQRFSTADGGSSVPFFLGGAPISPMVENHYHQFNPAGLELSYGNGNEGRHSSHKGKGKN